MGNSWGNNPSVFAIEFAADERVERHIATGEEVLDFNGLESIRVGRQEIRIDVCRKGENRSSMHAWLQIDSEQELAYLHNGGILPYVVRKALR